MIFNLYKIESGMNPWSTINYLFQKLHLIDYSTHPKKKHTNPSRNLKTPLKVGHQGQNQAFAQLEHVSTQFWFLKSGHKNRQLTLKFNLLKQKYKTGLKIRYWSMRTIQKPNKIIKYVSGVLYQRKQHRVNPYFRYSRFFHPLLPT